MSDSHVAGSDGDQREPAEHRLTLRSAEVTYVVCRLPNANSIPDLSVLGEALAESWWSLTRTRDEISWVMPESQIDRVVSRLSQSEMEARAWKREGGWRLIEVEGPLAFKMVGVLQSMVAPLADAGISLFTVSTYDSDYLLVKQDDWSLARQVLSSAGHRWAEVA